MAEDQANEAWRGKVGQLSPEELDLFLGGNQLARLAVLDERGWPYVQPVWFQWDPAEPAFWIIPRARSVWAQHMANDERVALTIDEATAPYRKVFVQGRAELVERPNVGGRWVEIGNEMSLRYLGEHGPDYLVPTLDQPRWLFRVHPDVMTTWQGVEWHSKYKVQS